MTTLQVEIPNKINNLYSFKKQNLDIKELFSVFWVDLDFLIEEKLYQKDYKKDLDNWNYIIK